MRAEPRKTNILKAPEVKAAIDVSGDKTTKLYDGESLFLVCRNGRGFWRYQFRDPITKKFASKGLGPADQVTLKRARQLRDDRASDNRRMREALKAGSAIPAVPTGGNLPVAMMPRHATAVAPSSVTFRAAARTYLESHANDWAPSERVRYARLLWVDWAPPAPKEGKEPDPVARVNLIADRPFRAIRPTDVRDVLTPIWCGPNHKPASLVRSLVERVLDAAAVEAGIDDYSNPAVWKGKLEHLLSGTSPEVEHFAAMDYKAVPAFLADAADPLLTFLVLTVSRLSEATGADWSEIDGNVWTIPADRYKTGKEHKVPLSQAALACLGDVMPANGSLFGGTPKALKHRLHKLVKGKGVTLHGFRSAFRDWAREVAKAPDDVAEMCLGHIVGSKTQQAYKRGDLMAERRALMDAWASYAFGVC